MLSNEFKRRFCVSLFGSCLSLYSVRPPGVLRNVDALIDEYLQVLDAYVERDAVTLKNLSLLFTRQQSGCHP